MDRLLAAPATAAKDGKPTLLGRAIPGVGRLPARAALRGVHRARQRRDAAISGAANPRLLGVLHAGHGEPWAMPDNGYGAKTNSSDFLLRVYRIEPDRSGLASIPSGSTGG
jgi:glycerophosphoryl diester phosphodiesterase